MNKHLIIKCEKSVNLLVAFVSGGVSISVGISVVSLQKAIYFRNFAYLLVVAEVGLDVWQN